MRDAVRDRTRAVVAGDRDAASELLPLVYQELRGLARSWLSRVPAGQTAAVPAALGGSEVDLADAHALICAVA